MDYKNTALCRIRTITVFLALTKNKKLWESEINQAAVFCSELSAIFRKNDYCVQSIRMVTNPFGEYMDTTDSQTAENDLQYISQLLDQHNESNIRLRFAIGEARTPHEISILPELIQKFGDLCNVCVNVPVDDYGILDHQLIQLSAQAVKQISQITPRGEGNFNFTVNFNCKPLIPYFPACYHHKELGKRFVIGLETPDLLVHTLAEFNKKTDYKHHNDLFRGYFKAMSAALQYHISQIQGIIDHADIPMPFVFSGFDSSAAPSKNCASMTDVYEQMGVEYFGAAGTVEASALLTRVFKSITSSELVGFSGLMLALTEDNRICKLVS